MRLLISLLLLTATNALAAPRPEMVLQIAGAGTVTNAVLSPSGQTVVASNEGDGAIQLWDTRTGEIRLHLHLRGGWSSDLAFSRDGRAILVSNSQSLQVWDALSGQLLQEWKIGAGVFSPDARQLAVGQSDGRAWWIEVWNVGDGTLQRTLPLAVATGDDADTNYLTSVAWSPDGAQLAAARRGGAVTLWENGAAARTINFAPPASQTGEKQEPMWIGALAFSADGQQLAVASNGQATRVAQTQTGRITRKLQVGKNASYSLNKSLLWTPDNRLLEADEGAAVRVWDVAKGQSSGQLAGTRGARSLHLARDGQILIGGVNPGLSLWDARTLQPKRPLTGSVNWLSALRVAAASGDAPYLALAPYHGAGALWDWRALERRALPTGANLFLPGAPLLMGAQGNALEWRRVPQGELWKKRTLPFKRGIEVLAAAPDGKTLAVFAGDDALLINARSGQTEGKLPPRSEVTRVAAFSPDGQWLAAGGGDEQGWGEERGTVTLWNLRAPQSKLRVLAAHNGVQSLAWSNNSHVLAVGCGNIEGNDNWGEIQLFDARSGALQRYLLGHNQPVESLHWSGDTLLAASRSDIKLWRLPADLQSAAQTRPLWTHDAGAMSVTPGVCGANFVLIQQDGTIEIRRRTDNVLLATLLDLPAPGAQYAGFLKNWILRTPDGYYTSSANCEKWIRWRENGKLYPAAKFAAQFRRPNLVKTRIGAI